MEITLTRNQIIGTGTIEHPKVFHQKSGKFIPDVSRAGRVTKINEGFRGQVVDLKEDVAERLCSLGSALIGSHKKESLPATS